ncbi:MAG: NAD(P)H-dependent oxidoreductase subunit E [Thermoanaerobaculia bacterium]
MGKENKMEEVLKIIEKYPKEEASLIQILQDINRKYNWLPREALEVVSREIKVPLARVYGVASFYKAFSLKERGKNIIKVCTGTACHIKGAPQLIDEIKRKKNIGPGETSEDKKFTLETVNCVGACAMAPVLILNERYFGFTKPSEIEKILEEGK